MLLAALLLSHAVADVGFGFRGKPYGLTVGDWAHFTTDRPQFGIPRYGQSSAYAYGGQGIGFSAVTYGGQVLLREGPAILGLDGAQMGAFVATRVDDHYFWAPMMSAGLDTPVFTVVARGGWSVHNYKGYRPKGDLSYGFGTYLRVAGVKLGVDYIQMGEDKTYLLGVSHKNFHVGVGPYGSVLMVRW